MGFYKGDQPGLGDTSVIPSFLLGKMGATKKPELVDAGYGAPDESFANRFMPAASTDVTASGTPTAKPVAKSIIAGVDNKYLFGGAALLLFLAMKK